MCMYLKVVTFNLGLMRIHAWGCTIFENPPMVAARSRPAVYRVRDLCGDADVVCIQECYEAQHRQFLRDAMVYHGHAAYSHDATWLNSGLMVFSKHPIIKSKRIPHAKCCAYERVLGDRAMLLASIQTAAGRVSVVNVHLSSGADPSSRVMTDIRAQQIADVDRLIRQLPRDDHVIVAGDFNFSPKVSPENYAQMSDLGLRDVWNHTPHPEGDEGITWDLLNPLNYRKAECGETSHRCDQIWVGRRIRPVWCAVIDKNRPVSDHYGVAATLILPEARHDA